MVPAEKRSCSPIMPLLPRSRFVAFEDKRGSVILLYLAIFRVISKNRQEGQASTGHRSLRRNGETTPQGRRKKSSGLVFQGQVQLPERRIFSRACAAITLGIVTGLIGSRPC